MRAEANQRAEATRGTRPENREARSQSFTRRRAPHAYRSPKIMPALTEPEFKATMKAPMVDVTAEPGGVVDIWPYVAGVAFEIGLPALVLEKELVEQVYRSADGIHDHVLLPTQKKNRFVVVVVDRSRSSVAGHHVLDLNRDTDSNEKPGEQAARANPVGAQRRREVNFQAGVPRRVRSAVTLARRAMSEVCTELATAFTTADTIGPVTVRYDGHQLVVSFANYGTPIQEVTFIDVRAFSWSGWDDAPAGAEFDGVCEVTGSRFLDPWTRFAVDGLPFRHFKFGFNAEAKFLDVIATRMEYKNG